jgi:hypothetical protein
MMDFVLWQGVDDRATGTYKTVREDCEDSRNAARKQKTHF